MSQNDIHQIIEKENLEGKEVLRKKVKGRLNLPAEAEQAQNKSSLSFFKKRYRIVASISSALVVVCLAIVLPIVLNRDTVPTERYCHAADCVETVIDYTIKDYSEKNNLSLLYIDWYNIADDIQTKLYVNAGNENDVIYLQERIINGETGSVVVLYISDLYTKVDIFEDVENSCENIEYISSIKVNWGYRNIIGTAYFEYSGRGYVIELTYPMAEDTVLELVESMIPKT